MLCKRREASGGAKLIKTCEPDPSQTCIDKNQRRFSTIDAASSRLCGMVNPCPLVPKSSERAWR
jgi:hypothetical protein